jgi:hypothetical protein
MKKGRKSKYFVIEDNWAKILELAKFGYLDEEICEYIGIGKTTYYKYLSENTEKAEAIKRQKVVANVEVENAMQKRAVGYEYVEEHLEYIPGGADGKTEVKVVKKIKKSEPPNPTAGIFLLKNRRPTKYKERQEVDLRVVDKEQAKKEIQEMFE